MPSARSAYNSTRRSAAATLCSPNSPITTTVTLRAQVKWWCRDKGLGYATPDAPSSLAKGFEVRLTAAAVTAANLSKPLWKGDAIIVTIDPRHERPYALDLKREVKGQADVRNRQAKRE